jgi:zinc transporter ZupT
MSLFLHYGLTRKKALVYLAIFALMTPLGSVASNLLRTGADAEIDKYFTYVMAMVVGIFLHVATSILFEAGENHKYNIHKLIVVFAGILIALFISLH